MEKLPESSVSLDLFSSQTARSGVGLFSLHSVTCSAGSSCCRMGTIADSFLWMVTGWVSAYSKKSSKALVETSPSCRHRWRDPRRRRVDPPPICRRSPGPQPLPEPTPPAMPADTANAGEGADAQLLRRLATRSHSRSAADSGATICILICISAASCVCGVNCASVAIGISARRV